MPIWLWLIVFGGLGYALAEVVLRDHRLARRRLRRVRAEAHLLGFEHHAHEQHRELTALLLLLPEFERPADVGPLYEGALMDGTPLTIFDFAERPTDRPPRPRVGFVLHYPTEWPTFELGAHGMQALAPTGNAHAFSRALLASTLCEELAAHGDWVFAFSGSYAFGATDQGDGDDLDRVLDVADGIALEIPRELITAWAYVPGVQDLESRAS